MYIETSEKREADDLPKRDIIHSKVNWSNNFWINKRSEQLIFLKGFVDTAILFLHL